VVTGPEHSNWTLDTLEKYFSERIDALKDFAIEREERSKERLNALKDAISQALASSEKAIAKAEEGAERKYESLNELRDMAQDQAGRFLTTAAYTPQHQALSEKIEALTTRIAAIESVDKGKSAGIGSVGTIVLGALLALSAVGSLVSVIFEITRAAH